MAFFKNRYKPISEWKKRLLTDVDKEHAHRGSGGLMNEIYQLIEKLAATSGQFASLLQDPLLDSLLFNKKNDLIKKLTATDFSKISTVYLGAHLVHARSMSENVHFVHLASDFLHKPPASIPKGAVFILLNNDIGKDLPAYIDFYNKNPQALFVIWDWDSQHWLQMSALCAIHCDVYISASSETVFALSHFNPCVIGPVFACVHQWSRTFVLNNLELLLSERADGPFGMHVHYEKYARRNRAIASVMQHFPAVAFANNDFKGRSDLENLKEWGAYKTHWIMPVLGGVPIRVYNALLTGGIPILPAFYQNMPEVAYLGTSPLYYDLNGLVEPHEIAKSAINVFNESGENGLIQRVLDGLARHHADTRCNDILLRVQRAVDGILRNDYAFHDSYLSTYHA
ncbi:hypothetical protein [Iodobacter sp. BJB302]|uniref:hypothetical protein n=1 Tax=Iodobacter sp. BJB302 TaxID=1506510 RepID=UPI00117BDD2C|nr:hypothetical protein [Iodobacter sp. BJB302]